MFVTLNQRQLPLIPNDDREMLWQILFIPAGPALPVEVIIMHQGPVSSGVTHVFCW